MHQALRVPDYKDHYVYLVPLNIDYLHNIKLFNID